MASVLLSSVTSGGNGGLIMPEMSLRSSLVSLKTSGGAEFTSSEAGFFTSGIDISHTELGWESVSLTADPDTTEQTIIDVSGAGVVTHAMASAMSSAASIMIFRFTIDGEVKTFTSESIPTTNRFCVGNFLTGRSASVSATTNVTVGSGDDSGYSLGTGGIMTTPLQSVGEFSIGIPFKTALKVTIQGSSNITGTAELNKAVVCYTTSIPEGL